MKMLLKLVMLVGSLVLGGIFYVTGMPIPWLLGGIFVAIASKNRWQERATLPRKWRNLGLTVVGYGIGYNLTPDTWTEMLAQTAGMVGATLLAVAIALAIAWWMARSEQVDLQSCIMGLLPGGFTQMAVMAAEDSRTNKNIVLVMQSLRLVSIIVAVPFLVTHGLGAETVATTESLTVTTGFSLWPILPLALLAGMIAERLKLSTPYLMGPIFATAVAAFTWGPLNTVPLWLMAPAQISIGLNMGLGIDLQQIKMLKPLLPYTFFGIVAMLVASIGVAFVLSAHYGFSLITAFLAMAPGGLGEMCLVGLSMGENVPIILTYQLFRFLFLNIAAPLGINCYFGSPPPQAEDE
ncbi:MAG: AbrB family transcriptional regulator [Acidaminococcaceae bacterium]